MDQERTKNEPRHVRRVGSMAQVNIFDHVEYRFHGKSGWKKGRSYGYINYFFPIGWLQAARSPPVPKERLRLWRGKRTLCSGMVNLMC